MDFSSDFSKNECNVSQSGLFMTENSDYAISFFRILGSLLSILGSTSVVIATVITGKFTKPEIHPLFTLSVGDIVLSLMWLIGGSLWLHDYHIGSHDEGLDTCYIVAIATTMATMVVSSLTVVYAIHALIIMKHISNNGGHFGKLLNQWWYYLITAILYIISWTLPIVLVLPVTEAAVGLSEAKKACWCYVDFFNTRPDTDPPYNKTEKFSVLALINAIYIGITTILSITVIIILYVAILFLAWKILKLQQGLIAQTRKAIRKSIIRASAFIGIYILCNLPPASIDVWNERTPLTLLERTDKGILFWQAIFSPLQGFLNALVYGWLRKEFRRAVLTPFKCCRNKNFDLIINRRTTVHAGTKYYRY